MAITARKNTILAVLLGVTAAAAAPTQAQTCGTTSWNLWAGQYTDVGSVTVSNDVTNLYVTYTLDYQNPECPEGAVDAEFGTLHLWVGTGNPSNRLDPNNTMPAVAHGPNAGIPIPGQFPYKIEDTGLQSYTFAIPFIELGITDVHNACGTTLYFVAHAEVTMLDCDGNPIGTDHETAFGGDYGVNVGDPGRWWYYGAYIVCCDFGGPPVPFCKTAYAKGGYVWTTQGRSNPEGLPSLRLTQNRWGWAIKLAQPGVTQYQIWAGAGLNKTSNGVLVGTLYLDWNGVDLSFCYDLEPGFTMQELHLYAGDDSPTMIAPGQFGYQQDFNELPLEDWCDTVPLADSNGGGVWVVAHSVVCSE